MTDFEGISEHDSAKEEQLEEHGRFRRLTRTLQVAKRAVEISVITVEVGPTNELIRYGAFGAALVETRNPVIGAAVLGGSTLLVEGAAALATADVISSDRATQAYNWINNRLEKVIPNNARMSPLVEGGIALYGGSVVVMAEKQRENPHRTKEQNRKYGLFTAGWLSGVLAVEGALIANGVDNYSDPKSVGAAFVVLGGLAAGAKWAKNHLKKEVNKTRYDLSQEELSDLENDLVSEVKRRFPEEGVYAAWIEPDHRYANLIRSYEAQYFPEVQTLPDTNELNTLFFALVDTRGFANRIVHGATISKGQIESHGNSTGFIGMDQLIEKDNFTAQEFKDYYVDRGIDVSKSISVETNFRVGEKTKPINGFTPAQYAYLSFFNRLEKKADDLRKAAIFSSINRASVLSFQRFGLDFEPLMGRTDLKTPEADLGLDYLPVVIPYTENNISLFRLMDKPLPEVEL